MSVLYLAGVNMFGWQAINIWFGGGGNIDIDYVNCNVFIDPILAKCEDKYPIDIVAPGSSAFDWRENDLMPVCKLALFAINGLYFFADVGSKNERKRLVKSFQSYVRQVSNQNFDIGIGAERTKFCFLSNTNLKLSIEYTTHMREWLKSVGISVVRMVNFGQKQSFNHLGTIFSNLNEYVFCPSLYDNEQLNFCNMFDFAKGYKYGNNDERKKYFIYGLEGVRNNVNGVSFKEFSLHGQKDAGYLIIKSDDMPLVHLHGVVNDNTNLESAKFLCKLSKVTMYNPCMYRLNHMNCKTYMPQDFRKISKPSHRNLFNELKRCLNDLTDYDNTTWNSWNVHRLELTVTGRGIFSCWYLLLFSCIFPSEFVENDINESPFFRRIKSVTNNINVRVKFKQVDIHGIINTALNIITETKLAYGVFSAFVPRPVGVRVQKIKDFTDLEKALTHCILNFVGFNKSDVGCNSKCKHTNTNVSFVQHMRNLTDQISEEYVNKYRRHLQMNRVNLSNQVLREFRRNCIGRESEGVNNNNIEEIDEEMESEEDITQNNNNNEQSETDNDSDHRDSATRQNMDEQSQMSDEFSNISSSSMNSDHRDSDTILHMNQQNDMSDDFSNVSSSSINSQQSIPRRQQPNITLQRIQPNSVFSLESLLPYKLRKVSPKNKPWHVQAVKARGQPSKYCSSYEVMWHTIKSEEGTLNQYQTHTNTSDVIAYNLDTETNSLKPIENLEEHFLRRN